MTELEMLKLAAYAADIELLVDEIGRTFRVYHTRGTQKSFVQWSPLGDDGDALRLAVKCGIEVSIFYDEDFTRACAGYTDQYWFEDAEHTDESRYIFEFHGSDPYAATRKAIVKVAAEIGRNMK